MELKKIIIRLLVFLLSAFGCYLIVVYLLLICKSNSESLIYSVSDVIVRKGGNTFRKFSDFDQNKTYDVVVIGSSHAYRGYDPRIFRENGITLFNLGTSGQTPLNTYYLVKNYIHAAHCKLVILDVYDGALTSDGVESTADLMQNIGSNNTVLKMGCALKDPRMLTMMAVRLFKAAEEPEYRDKTYVMNGFSETKDSLQYTGNMDYATDQEWNPAQFSYFEKTLRYLQEQQINVVVVTHPAPLEWNLHKHKEISSRIEALAGNYQVEYMDYFNYPGFNSRFDFYDTHHLNQTGVQKFNTLLIQDLKRGKYLSKGR